MTSKSSAKPNRSDIKAAELDFLFSGIGLNYGEGLLAPLEVISTAELLADRLVTAIALGEFMPGERLPAERQLAQMLNISRSTVREALGRLAAHGYVTMRRGRGGGTFVCAALGRNSEERIRRTMHLTWKTFEELLDFRMTVEQTIARLAATRRTRDDIAAMHTALAVYREATDRESSRAADEALHFAIARATHNSYLVGLSARIRATVSLGIQAQPYSAQLRQRALRQHPALVDAIVDGKAAYAAKLAGKHFAITDDALRQLYRHMSAQGVTVKRPYDDQAADVKQPVAQHDAGGKARTK